MFKANNQPQLFSFEDELGKKVRDALEGTKEKWLYHLVLRNINEGDFRALYSDKARRPNVPVNVLVCALILKELKGLSYDELMESEVRFEMNTCKQCPLKEKCQAFRNKGRYYFTHEDYLQNRRNWNILNIPEERRKIRPNVEALMNEFKIRTSGGKLKVRGLFKTTLFAFNTGIAINFGRVYRFIAQNGLTNGFDQSIGAILQNVELNLSHLWHKTENFVCDFFSRLIFGEYFPPRVILQANISTRQTFN